MVNTLMDISEAEAGVLALRREPFRSGTPGRRRRAMRTWPRPSTSPWRSADPSRSTARDRLRQVFANLLDNAIKYTPDRGSVRIDVSRDDDMALVSVADTGAGIGAEHLPRIFERLYRADASRSERGLGLGLSLVKAYVAAHGGTVEARSDPGRGSIFTVRLPVRSTV